MAEKTGGVAWLTLIVSGATLVVTGLTAIADSSTKHETNGVARAAVIKDLMVSLLNESSPRGKELAFEALISSLPVSSSSTTAGYFQPVANIFGGKKQAEADAIEFGSITVFLTQLWQTESDRTVRCYYYQRLLTLKIILSDAPSGQDPSSCLTKNSLASIASPKVEKANVAVARSPELPTSTAVPAESTTTTVFEKRSGSRPSGPGKSFSQPYELCSDPLPDPAMTIVSSDFFLLGDRSCGSWATCEPSVKEPTRVCWKFTLQGHDERPFNSVGLSEGVLRYTVQKR